MKNLALTALEEDISAEDVAGLLHTTDGEAASTPLEPLFSQPLREARDAFEKLYFEHVLRQEGGNMTRVSERSGVERTHLYRKLKQLGVSTGKRGGEG